ncbi:MAG: response regulator transcription factor [Sulfurovum sp.]|nr:response regulator transcription factor [Sulfurovum sp.]
MNLDALKHLSLLYVEDEPFILQNAVEYLNRYCHKVYEAVDGVQGLEMFHTHRPDIVISDIHMPHMGGLELATKIRETDKETPIIIATAHTQTEYLLKAVELHLVKYLVKPITSEKLNEALAMASALLQENTEQYIILSDTIFFDTLNKTLFKDKIAVKLTYNEQKLFELLISNSQRAVTYEEIESAIWAYEGMSKDALRSLVRSLRKKLSCENEQDNFQNTFIANISGIGYTLTLAPHQT